MALWRFGMREPSPDEVRPSDGLDSPTTQPYISGIENDQEESLPVRFDRDLEQQGMWSKKKLDRFAYLQFRGIPARPDAAPEDPPHGTRRSAHEPPPLYRVGGGKPAEQPADAPVEAPTPAFRSAHEVPAEYRRERAIPEGLVELVEDPTRGTRRSAHEPPPNYRPGR